MNKTILYVLIGLLMVSFAAAITCPGQMAGDGKLATPCIITNCTQLQNMSKALGANYTLNNNIECNDTMNWYGGKGFRPIGFCNGAVCYDNDETPFTGTFDGKNYSIYDLYYYNTTGGNGAGLFGSANNATLMDVRLVNFTLHGGRNMGSLVGYIASRRSSGNHSCIIKNVFVDSAYINSTDATIGEVGCVAGYIYNSNVSNSYGNCTIYQIGAATGEAGGFSGSLASSTVENCFSKVFINSSANAIGGFVGNNYQANITNSYSISNIRGWYDVGGFVGSSSGGSIIDNCYSISNVTVLGSRGGGFVGDNNAGVINNSWANSTINGGATGDIGSFIGENSATVDNCFTTGKSYCTAACKLGAFFGDYDSGTVNNIYWNNHSGNPSVCAGEGAPTCNVIQDNEAYFYYTNNSPLSEWDFTTIWNNRYNTTDFPVFIWQDVNLPPYYPIYTTNASAKTTKVFTATFSAYDVNGISSYSVNDTTRFTMNPTTGVLRNIIVLDPGEYNLLITVTDNYNNQLSIDYLATILSLNPGEQLEADVSPSLRESANSILGFFGLIVVTLMGFIILNLVNAMKNGGTEVNFDLIRVLTVVLIGGGLLIMIFFLILSAFGAI